MHSYYNLGQNMNHPRRYLSKKQATRSRDRVIMSAITVTAALSIPTTLVHMCKCISGIIMISMMS